MGIVSRVRASRAVQEAVVKLASQHDGTVKRYAPQALVLALEGHSLDVGTSAMDLDGGGQSMYGAIHDLAKEKVTPLSLKQLYTFGKNPTPEQRLANARFLHRELPVRLSQRAVELMNLPHGLSSMPGIQQVSHCYVRYAWELLSSPKPTSAQEEYEFSCLLSGILLDGQSIPRALSIGLQDFHNRLPVEDGGLGGCGSRHGALRDLDPSVRRAVQSAVDRFFTGRIGVRFLIEHHVSTVAQANLRPGWSGIIQSAVAPSVEARHAAAEVRALCTRHLGAAPNIHVLGPDENTFTYVPSHLEVMLSEQLKNATRAVVERHHPAYTSMAARAGPIEHWGEKECMSVKQQALAARNWPDGGPQMPPIKVTVAMGKYDVTIKIADEGGGAPRSDMDLLWTYYYTTANKFLVGANAPPPELTGSGEMKNAMTVASGNHAEEAPGATAADVVEPLAGFGVGLPLSRVYAKYFGGDIMLKSMEGFGMDSYLHLNRLGHDCEELPPLVRHSPAERDSTLDDICEL